MSSPAAPEPKPPWTQSSQIVLAVLVLVALGLISYHSWNLRPGNARPTDLVSAPNQVTKIELNQADRAQLLLLPGVGETLAERIEEHRRQRQGFDRVEDLLEVRGMGEKTLARLRPWVHVIPRQDGSEERSQIPFAEPVRATNKEASAPKWRTSRKPILSASDVVNVNTASPEELQRLPGIGATLSQRIVDHRVISPFQDVEDLREIRGIGPKTMEKIRPFVRVK